jgi:hypothetical protein
MIRQNAYLIFTKDKISFKIKSDEEHYDKITFNSCSLLRQCCVDDVNHMKDVFRQFFPTSN